MNDQLWAMGFKEQMDYLKIMVSTEELDTSVFIQEPLNLDGTGAAMKAVLRAGGLSKPDWTSFLIPLHIIKS
jgi:hypothetical protein